jgi:RHS repeat-associated protein
MRDNSERTLGENDALSGPAPLQAPSINLPKGGGAIRGIGEKFAANPVTGTGSWTVPIAVSPGRSGFAPALSLAYDSGAGNGPFGLGWTLALPAIMRKTDKGLPRYDHALNSDEFVLSGAEDLVPVLIFENGQWVREAPPPRTLQDRTYRIERYRPRIEGSFARIECWTNHDNPADCFWRAITRDNVTTWYGRTGESRVTDPSDPARIFSWLICESYDDKGNVMVYGYRPEDSIGVDRSQANETNRTQSSRSANRYLTRVRYGNSQPYFPDPASGTFPPLPVDWLFEVVCDYGEHDQDAPLPDESGAWNVRHDPFSTYRAGFEVRTYRLCQRVLMFHHFADETGVGANCLVRSTDLTYRYEQTPGDPRQPIHTELTSVTHCGYRRHADGYLRHALPSLDFEYSQAVLGNDLQSIESDSLEQLPSGVDGSVHRWLDLDGEGMPGVLTELGEAWFYKHNTTPLTRSVADDETVRHRASLSPVNALASIPGSGLSGTSRRQFLDLAGDGQVDVVELQGPVAGYYERTPEQGWQPFRAFLHNPNVDWDTSNLRMIDLTGDGHDDLLMAEWDVLTWYPSLGEDGFGAGLEVRIPADEERGPRPVLASGNQMLFQADMSGDGLNDLVRVRNGEICYWPNLGYGRFGAKVMMDAAPWFDNPEQFDPARVRLADIDGSGVTDIIYLGRMETRVWFNQSGNTWSAPHTLAGFPSVDDATSVAAVDLLANGTACLVWSRPARGESHAPVSYLELMAAGKPHLLVGARNNLGAETRLRYAPSTYFYLQDKHAGTPWITRLPFPVHVVERVETLDHISRNRFVTRYAYHHGYFDGEEREFRGFGMVEQFDTEEFAVLNAVNSATSGNVGVSTHVPPVLTRTWFHTGAYQERSRISNFFAGTLDEEDAGEYYREPGLTDEQARGLLLDDTVLPAGLSATEEREACRALKGLMLRQEVYALDGTDAEPHPFTVAEQNFSIRCLQPMGGHRHAVFFTHARETLNYHYERSPIDPRVDHALTLEVDASGNVTKSASIAYGRRAPDPLLGAADQAVQARTHITYTEVDYTNSAIRLDTYRTPLSCGTRTYELTGYVPTAGVGRFRISDFVQPDAEGRATHIFDAEMSYEEVPDSGRQRRLIESLRLLYRPDDLGGNDPSVLLPLGELEPLALYGESYQLAFTQDHLNLVFGDRVTETMLSDEGGYVGLADDGAWWIPSGRMLLSSGEGDSPAQELAFARQHFFIPRRFRDPFGETAIDYDAHDLLMVRTTDPLGNSVTARNDYRVLAPDLIVDANGNRVSAAFDALGMVVGTAVMEMGDSLDEFEDELSQEQTDAFFDDPKGTIATELLRNASTRTIYDETRFWRVGQPACAATIARETHTGVLAAGERPPVQVSLAYSDGFGRIIQNKLQAEPGPVEDGGESIAQRWTTSGWTVFNNKGNPIKQYEPFFSADHTFEFGVTVGVSSTRFYDPVGRVVATLHPNHTWEKVVFDPWREESYDVNDTVLTNPHGDADVGDFFRRLSDGEYLPTWHALRTDPAHVAEAIARWPDDQHRRDEAAAALKSAAHAGTPAVVHFDSLGRSFLSIADNGPGGEVPTRIDFDIEGNTLSTTDARGNVVMAHALGGSLLVTGYDIAGRQLYENSMDGGERRMLPDIAGKPIRRWDSRRHALRFAYDPLQRPTHLFVRREGESELVVQRTIYGEHHPNAEALNLRGRIFRVYDAAGVVTNQRLDPKGNLLDSSREVAAEYRSTVDWSVLADLTDIDQLENAAAPLLLSETFATRTRYDALNRAIEVITPDESVTLRTYNEASLLERTAVRIRGAEDAAPLIAAIDYNARGQRTRVAYATADGSGFTTTYTYDPETFRMIRLHTVRGRDGRSMQDLNHVYDPAGNVTSIRDNAQQTVFFANAQVEPHNDYTYDALHRLIEAHGREHAAQNNAQRDDRDSAPIVGIPFPNSSEALQRYREEYAYDRVGNILSMTHIGGAIERWRRLYRYADDNDRLLATTVPTDGASEFSASYSYDTHGNMARMPHLPAMQWDFMDQLQSSSRQVVNEGTPETTYYVYDATGQRVRKVTERFAAPGEVPIRRSERLYFGAFEIYREHSSDGNSTALRRDTLHVSDDKQRIAQIDTRSEGSDDAAAQSRRFVLSNHLGSAALEVDEDANVISYEEYHPYGTSACIAARSATEVNLKRHRFAGEERDEETGLYYQGARYYACWLGRWTAVDPIRLLDGSSMYTYCGNAPTTLRDPSGMAPVHIESEQERAARLQREAVPASHSLQDQTAADAARDPMPPPIDPSDVNHPGNYDTFEQFKAAAQGPFTDEGLRDEWELRGHPAAAARQESVDQIHLQMEQEIQSERESHTKLNYWLAKNALGLVDVVAQTITLGGLAYGEGVPEIEEARNSGGAAVGQIGSLAVGRPSSGGGGRSGGGGGGTGRGPAPGPRALPASGETAGSIPTLVDTNVLVKAYNLDLAALAEVRTSSKRVTSGVYQEFMSGTPADRAARKAFLAKEGVTRYSKTESAAIRKNSSVKEVGDAVGNQVDTTRAVRRGHSKVDRDLAGWAKATGQQLLTHERRLFNVLTNQLRRLNVAVRRFF